jgi:hypothetical protein
MYSAFGVDHGVVSKGLNPFKAFVGAKKAKPKSGINPGFGNRQIAPGGPVQRGSSGGSNAMEDQRKAALAAVQKPRKV